jgi:hypothetical protein
MDYKIRYLFTQLSNLFNRDTYYFYFVNRFIVLVRFNIAYFLCNVHTLDNSPKYSVLFIQPRLKNCKIKIQNDKIKNYLTSIFTHGITVMKNCDPLVLGPAFAMLSVYGLSCFNIGWNSSSNSCPHIEVPPVPFPCGSPVWIINCFITFIF